MSERDELLTAVVNRLQQVAETQDVSLVLEPEAFRESVPLTVWLATNSADLDVRLALGWLHWYRFRALPEGEDLQDLDAAVQMLVPCFAADAGNLPEPLVPLIASRAAPVVLQWQERSRASGDAESLAMAADVWQRIFTAVPPDGENRAAVLSSQAEAWQARYELSGEQADLDAAIEARQAAADALPASHPGTADHLDELGRAVVTRFDRMGDPADAYRAVLLFQRAVDVTPAGHPDRPMYLNNLGNALQYRFRCAGDPADLDAAVDNGRAAVAATPADHDNRTGRLLNLESALLSRFERRGELADLDAAIETLRDAVSAAPAGHPDRGESLNMLGRRLLTRFERVGDTSDLNSAVEVGRQALATGRTGDPEWAEWQTNLAIALRARSERLGNLSDLKSAVQLLQSAVSAAPPGHPRRPGRLSNLGGVLWTRFERTGAPDDLDAAIEALQDAVVSVGPGHPDLAGCVGNLGSALTTRFERTGNSADLDAAIEALQVAAAAAPDTQHDRAATMSNLGNVMRIRFARTRNPADLEAAIDGGRAAVAALPEGHPDRPMYLSNLGNALQERFRRRRRLGDLDNAVEMYQSAVDATPVGHAELPMYLNNLGVALQDRFEYTGDRGDLERAIAVLKEGEAAAPVEDTYRPDAQNNLGRALRVRFQRGRVPADRDEAFLAFQQAANSKVATPSSRIQALRNAATLADPGEAASLLEEAVLLLPEVAPRLLERGDQQHALARLSGLAGDAAALALADPAGKSRQRAVRALRLLESGRAVLLSQALDTRSDLTDLKAEHPALAKRFTRLRDQLNQAPTTPVRATRFITDSRAPKGGGPSVDRSDLNDQLAATLAEIRAQAGFASFALPPSINELHDQARSGPVVTFNVSRYRSDALLLTADTVTAINLPGLALQTVLEKANAFLQALEDSPGTDPEAVTSDILGWLWDTAAEPVLLELGCTSQPPDGTPWPRVWWAPGGGLGLLPPIHAAGHHADPPGPRRRTVMDRVISSYTPTIRALQYARQHASQLRAGPPDAIGRPLVVAMPTTPGIPGRLRGVRRELAMLRECIPDLVVLAEPEYTPDKGAAVLDQIPTKANVLAQLRRCPIAHFACHGYCDPADPSRSLLLLHDHREDPLTVDSLATVDLTQARLAYLSACSTARNKAADLVDEAINLVTAFQLAGFPHVIGTLWEIGDKTSFAIAEKFYSYLNFSTAAIDVDQAAHALHFAVDSVRDNIPMSLWAAYLHAGA